MSRRVYCFYTSLLFHFPFLCLCPLLFMRFLSSSSRRTADWVTWTRGFWIVLTSYLLFASSIKGGIFISDSSRVGGPPYMPTGASRIHRFTI
ncbi:hypothetical protein K440DRAFT_618363 [Wilcoxina mikolae CBS 423.85]|nr:hypothetical protein K440DRAFT_618363 [Wilcoxina mikolae CBS 423.85]